MEEFGLYGGREKELEEKLADEGKTPLFFVRDGRFIGIIALADVVKPTSRRAVNELHEMGIKVVMLTGDNERTARAIQREVGADEVIAARTRLSPRCFRRTRRKKFAAFRSRGGRSRWSATASTTLPRSRARMSA